MYSLNFDYLVLCNSLFYRNVKHSKFQASTGSRGVIPGRRKGHSPPNFFEIVGYLEVLLFVGKNFQTFAIGTEKSCEFHRMRLR